MAVRVRIARQNVIELPSEHQQKFVYCRILNKLTAGLPAYPSCTNSTSGRQTNIAHPRKYDSAQQ